MENYVLREYEIHPDTNEEFETIIDKDITLEQAQEHLHSIYQDYYENPEVDCAEFDIDNDMWATIDFKNGTTLDYRIGTDYQENEEQEYNNLNKEL